MQTWIVGGTRDDPCSPMGMRCFVHICEEFEDATADPEMFGTREAVQATFGITEQDACGFAIYGLETHDQLNFEGDINRVVDYAIAWELVALAYEKQLVEQYRIRVENKEKLEQRLTEYNPK